MFDIISLYGLVIVFACVANENTATQLKVWILYDSYIHRQNHTAFSVVGDHCLGDSWSVSDRRITNYKTVVCLDIVSVRYFLFALIFCAIELFSFRSVFVALILFQRFLRERKRRKNLLRQIISFHRPVDHVSREKQCGSRIIEGKGGGGGGEEKTNKNQQ